MALASPFQLPNSCVQPFSSHMICHSVAKSSCRIRSSAGVQQPCRASWSGSSFSSFGRCLKHVFFLPVLHKELPQSDCSSLAAQLGNLRSPGLELPSSSLLFNPARLTSELLPNPGCLFCLQTQAEGAGKPPLRPQHSFTQSLANASGELHWSGELSQELSQAAQQQQVHLTSRPSSDSLHRPSPSDSLPSPEASDLCSPLAKKRSRSLPRNISTSSFDDYMVQSATSNGQLRKYALHPLPSSHRVQI